MAGHLQVRKQKVMSDADGEVAFFWSDSFSDCKVRRVRK